MRRAALALLLVALAAGCGSGANLAGTHLTVTAFNAWVGKAFFHLDCAPVGGDIPDAASACAALRGNPGLVTSPKPFNCIGTETSHFDMTISGQLAGKPVHQAFSSCWTAQSPTLGKLGLVSSLGRHVRPRRHGRVAANTTRTFAAGTLRPGDLVLCTILGHQLRLGVPETAGSIGSMGWGGKDVVSVILTGSRHADGSVNATCGPDRTAVHRPTRLTVAADSLKPHGGHAVFRLSCQPTGGDVPKPARACAALIRKVFLVASPRSFHCRGGVSSWWELTVSGRLQGSPIERHVATCWTQRSPTIRLLGLTERLLRQRIGPSVLRVREILPWKHVRFAAGALRQGDIVTCEIRGHRLGNVVPAGPAPNRSGIFRGHDVGVMLTIRWHRDGSVAASCLTARR